MPPKTGPKPGQGPIYAASYQRRAPKPHGDKTMATQGPGPVSISAKGGQNPIPPKKGQS